MTTAERQSDSGSISKVEATEFPCGLDVRKVGKKGIDEYFMILKLGEWGKGHSLR